MNPPANNEGPTYVWQDQSENEGGIPAGMTRLIMAGSNYFVGSGICSFSVTYGMRDRFKLAAECGIKNGKSHVTDVTRRTTNITGRDKHSEWGGMAGLSQK